MQRRGAVELCRGEVQLRDAEERCNGEMQKRGAVERCSGDVMVKRWRDAVQLSGAELLLTWMTSSIVRGLEVMVSSTSGLLLARDLSTSTLSSPVRTRSCALSRLATLPALHLLPEEESLSQGTSGRCLPHHLMCLATFALLLNSLPHRVQAKVAAPAAACTPLMC